MSDPCAVSTALHALIVVLLGGVLTIQTLQRNGKKGGR